jgi:thiamine kinase
LAQSLSATTGSEIERVTRLCQRLEFFVIQPPQEVRALSHGESNQSYYVKTGQGEYVLRCYPAESVVCRQQELRCQHAAAAKGLAPAPLCLNNHYQVLLSDYIPAGVPFDYHQHGANYLLSTLAKFHQLAVQTPQLDCTVYLQQLVRALPVGCQAEPALLSRLEQTAQRFAQWPADRVLCHLDLHAGNLLFVAPRLWLLDFEYSQQADSSLDLAAVCLHFNLTTAQEQQLLTGYANYRQQTELSELLAQKLSAAKQLYCGFCWLWYLAIPGYQPQAQHWRQRLCQVIESDL